MSALWFVAGLAVGVVACIAIAGGFIMASTRPARGTYRVHYHRFDADGQRTEGSHAVDAMNANHAESVALVDLFSDRVDSVERVE